MCDEACNRLEEMEKCSARLFTDIYRKRERKYAKLLYEEYLTMERSYEYADMLTTVPSEVTTKDIKVATKSPLMKGLHRLFP